MAERTDRDREHPIAAGLLALVGVGVVVGLILGTSALLGTRVLGIDEPSAASTGDGEASMYLPKPEPTKPDNGPQLTLAPGEDPPPSAEETKKPDKPDKATKDISLSAGQTSVSPMDQIDLTGVYPGGEGSILQVQRFENGGWTDFPASPVSVSNQTFSTYVQTGQPGVQRFRMRDTGSDRTSNQVKVRVS